MGLPRNLGAYTDIQEIFDACIEANSGATITLETSAAAVRFRMRAYYYRTLRAAAHHKGETPYDELILRIKKGECTVRIDFISSKGLKISFDNKTAIIPTKARRKKLVETPPSDDDDDLLRIARGVSLDLGL